MKHEFHNPDNLSPEQVGKGYRLLLKNEIRGHNKRNGTQLWYGGGWSPPGCFGNQHDITYRVPLSSWPLPGEKEYAAPPVKNPEVEPLQERFAEPQGTKWQGHPKGETSPPTDNDTWESLLRTNANLGRELAAVKQERDDLRAHLAAVEEEMKGLFATFTRWHKIGTKEEEML